MAGTSGYLRYNDQSLDSFHAALDPKSLILSQFSNSDQPQMLQLTTAGSYFMKRGPRYNDYAALRESRLRMKSMKQPNLKEEELIQTPPKKQVTFQGNFTTPPKRPKGSSSSSSFLTQSMTDFSSVLRKENRKPHPAVLPPVMEKTVTPPPLRSKSGNGGRFDGIMGKLSGSKSVNYGEKMSGLMARKSYASMEELRGLASDARNGINGENRGGRFGRGVGKNVLGYIHF